MSVFADDLTTGARILGPYPDIQPAIRDTKVELERQGYGVKEAGWHTSGYAVLLHALQERKPRREIIVWHNVIGPGEAEREFRLNDLLIAR